MASILNPTLVVPPVLDHQAVVLGSCPKFRVTSPNDIGVAEWNHSIQIIRSRRYAKFSAVHFGSFQFSISSWIIIWSQMRDIKQFYYLKKKRISAKDSELVFHFQFLVPKFFWCIVWNRSQSKSSRNNSAYCGIKCALWIYLIRMRTLLHWFDASQEQERVL